MKKRILIIYNGFALIEQAKYKMNRLKEELNAKGLDVDLIPSTSLLTSNRVDKTFFNNYYFAISLDKDYYLSKLISQYINIYNETEATRICDDKMATILYLKKNNIHTPKTISAPLCYLDELDENKIDDYIKLIEKEFTYPFVFKLCYGSLGKQVMLINNRKELLVAYKKNYNKPHLYEEYLFVNSGTDYRVIVINNKVEAVMERKNTKDFRSNIYLGGKGTNLTNNVNPLIKEIALDATKSLKLNYSGVDVMLDNNNTPCILEVNSNPFFSEVEKVTNINVSKILIDYLLKLNEII